MNLATSATTFAVSARFALRRIATHDLTLRAARYAAIPAPHADNLSA